MDAIIIVILFLAALIIGVVIAVIVGYFVAGLTRSEILAVCAAFLALVIVTSFLFNIFQAGAFSSKKVSDTLIFAGQIVNSSVGDWNNRLVLVYERKKEVGRTTTFRGEFPESGRGIIDGLFVVEVPNVYRFSLTDFQENKVFFDFYLTNRSDGFLKSHSAIYYWFPKFTQGTWKLIELPSKDLYYIIKVLDGDITTLPPEILSGKTEFRNGPIVVLTQETPPPALGVEGEYIVQEVRSNLSIEKNAINKFTVPLDNCKSDQELHTPYTYSQTYVHKYSRENSLSGGVEVPVFTWLKIVAELQTKYVFEDNQISETSMIYDMKAAPHTYQYFVVTWTEVWEKGIAYVVKDNRAIEVPFRVKTNVIYQVESVTKPCP